MYYEKINNNILSIISLFILGCNYQILNPNNSNSSNNSNEGNNNGSNEDNSSNGSGNNSGEDNDNSENLTKTIYFKFKVSGKSSQEAFNKNDIFGIKIWHKGWDKWSK